jgi:hypothetical protein
MRIWPIASALHDLHGLPYKKDWRHLSHGSIPINNRQYLDTLLYADDQVLLADSEDSLQLSLHNFKKNW